MQRKYNELFIEPELEIDTAERQRASYVRKTFYVSEELLLRGFLIQLQELIHSNQDMKKYQSALFLAAL